MAGSRRQGRQAALQMLYQLELSGVAPARVCALYWQHFPNDDPTDVAFADTLVEGFASNQSRVDQLIGEASHHWRLERMSHVDRNVLRVAVTELLCRDDVPAKVTLNEAVELAKRFGSEGSASFVNGVLDKIATDLGQM